jgi:hypothetical protein
MSNNNNVNGLNPELGDLVTFQSESSSVTGRIIFRNDDLIRIRPYHKRTRAAEFELDPETHTFLEKYGVREIIIHEKRKYPHFSKQLSVSAGDILEYYSIDGTKIGESKPVFEIIANDEYDGIKFDDGTTVDFGFIGPPEDIGVIVVTSIAAEPEDNSSYDAQNDSAIPDIPEVDISELLQSTSLIREVPSEELVYDDSVQREDMFVSILMDYHPSQQQNPRIMQKVYRETDLYLSLKNAVRQISETSLVPTARSYTVSTVLEAVEKEPDHAPIASVIPVADVKRVVYGDLTNDNSKENVEIRNEMTSLGTAHNATENFTGFVNYINKIMKSSESYAKKDQSDRSAIGVDQEVIRSVVPPDTVNGLAPLGKELNSLTTDAVTKIRPQIARLLTGNIVRDPRSVMQIKMADADSAKTVAHVLASPSLSLRRARNRSSVLIWDVLASNASRTHTKLYVDELETEVKTIVDSDEFTLASILQSRIPQALSLADVNVVMVTDSLGLRNLEMSDDLMKPLDDALQAGQAAWNNDYKKLIASATAALHVKPGPVIQSIGPIADIQEEPVQSVLQKIKERETTLHTLDLAVMNELNKEAESSLIHIYYGLMGGVSENVMINLKTTYDAENSRQMRNIQTQREKASEFTAEPIINDCPHVHEYELLMKVKDDQKRMILFETFFDTYQAGEKGDFYICGTCNTNLVCKHEVMMLNEYLNKDQSLSSHKELLLRFAGPVFEGNYTCKNCGQKIKEIEYDTSLEFDDNGNPLVGRSVIETEEMDQEDRLIMSDKMQDLPFDENDPNKLTKYSLYKIARTIMERIGYVGSKDIYNRIINSTLALIEKLATITKKVEVLNTYKIALMTFLVLMEFQINQPDIPIPARGCIFSRAGFPRDNNDPVGQDTGALQYVLCATASIDIQETPWNNTLWSSLVDRKARVNSIKENVVKTLGFFKTLAKESYSGYMTLLETSKSEDVVQQFAKDILPPSFRPLVAVDVEMIKRTPIANVEIFKRNVQEKSVETIGVEVYNRELQLIQEVIQEFHNIQKDTNASSKRSETDCCFDSLKNVYGKGFGMGSLSHNSAELQTLMEASNIIRSRDSATVNGGTHIYVPWSAPIVSTELPQPNPESYYALFLKHCYAGDRVGDVHEFDMMYSMNPDKQMSTIYKCRHCEFTASEKLLLDKSDQTVYDPRNPRGYNPIGEYIQEAKRLMEANGVTINDKTFSQLEQSVRAKKKVIVPKTEDIVPVLELLHGFQFLSSQIALNEKESVTMDSLKTEIYTMIDNMNKRQIQDREIAFVPFFNKYNALANNLFRSSMNPTKSDELSSECKTYLNERRININAVDTARMFTIASNLTMHRIHGPRNVIQYFIIPAKKLCSASYTIHNMSNVNGETMSRWFGRQYNRKHMDELKKSWEKLATLMKMLNSVWKDYEDDTKEDIKSVLSKFVNWMGPLTNQWVTYMVPNNELHESEIVQIYKWITIFGLAECMNKDGVLYVDVVKAGDRRERVQNFVSLFIVLSLLNADSQMFEFQKSVEQIREAINTRATAERAGILERINVRERGDREVALLNKKFGLGEWSDVYTSKYNSANFDKHLKQMEEFGVLDRKVRVGAEDTVPTAETD